MYNPSKRREELNIIFSEILPDLELEFPEIRLKENYINDLISTYEMLLM